MADSGDLNRSHGVRERWSIGDVAYFEYHCLQSHQSGDAEAWYRSHQRVLVASLPASEGLAMSEAGADREERLNEGCPMVYTVEFADGHRHDAFEDELWVSAAYFSPEWAPTEPLV